MNRVQSRELGFTSEVPSRIVIQTLQLVSHGTAQIVKHLFMVCTQLRLFGKALPARDVRAALARVIPAAA